MYARPNSILWVTLMQSHQLASKDPSHKFPLEGCDIATVSEETLISLVDTAPVLHRFAGTKIVRLSRNLVLKAGADVLPSETYNMRYVAEVTSIRLPRIHRAFNIPGEGYHLTTGYIVMDYIEGQCLADIWNVLEPERRENVVRQVAEMIRQLQSIHLSTPGPIGGGPCRGMWFTVYGAGPFQDRQQIEDWFNHKLAICKRLKNAKEDTPRFDFQTFVLTHHDICPRNLILDTSEHLWLIDWAFAGAYPPVFEAATIMRQHPFTDFNQQVLQSINYDPEKIQQLESITYGLSTGAFL